MLHANNDHVKQQNIYWCVEIHMLSTLDYERKVHALVVFGVKTEGSTSY